MFHTLNKNLLESFFFIDDTHTPFNSDKIRK